MIGLVSKLFPTRRNRTIRRAAATVTPAAKAPHLGVESLGDRIMPAVTVGLSNGVLSVTGDHRNDSTTVSEQVRIGYTYNAAGFITGTTSTSVIRVNDWTTGGVWEYGAASVSSIAFSGNAGDDDFHNATGKRATFDGGSGNDWLKGGSNTDIFLGSTGNDQYFGEGGQDVLDRRGHRGYFSDDRPNDGDLTIGQVAYSATNRLSAAELRKQGDLTVSLDPANSQRLILNGPSGAAIVLQSSWVKNGNAFETSGAVTMETVDGNVPVAPSWTGTGLKTRVLLHSSPVANAGNFHSITWAGVAVTSNGNPLNGLIDRALGSTGVDITLPDLKWGIALGDDVKGMDGSAPLNNAVPYLFGSFNSGASVSVPNVSASTPNGLSTTMAYAPSDGTVYAGLNDYGVAVSRTGYIPYDPSQIPDGVSNPNIFGHFHARGAMQVNAFSISGSVTLDLDANDNGRAALLDAAAIKDKLATFAVGLADGSSINELGVLAQAAMGDTAVGLNGSVSLGLKDIVEINLGNASAWYKPGQIAFRAETSNPFEGIKVLEKIGNTKMTVQGYANWGAGWTSPNFWLQASASSSSLSGLPVGNLTLTASNTTGNGIWVNGSVALANVAYFNVSGSIGFDGSFGLSGSYGSYRSWENRDLGLSASTSFTVSVDISYNSKQDKFTFSGELDAWAKGKQNQVGEVTFSANAKLNISVGTSGISVSGSGSVSATYWDFIWDKKGDDKTTLSVGFSFTNRSLTIDPPVLDKLVDTFTINW